MGADNPAGRLVKPEDIAEAVTFLCSARGGDDPRPDADRRRRLLSEADGAHGPQPPRVRRRAPHRRERPRHARDAGPDPGAAARCERQPRPPPLLRHGPRVARSDRAGSARHGRRRRRGRDRGGAATHARPAVGARRRPRAAARAAARPLGSRLPRLRLARASARRSTPGPAASRRRCGAAACCCSTTSTPRAHASTRSGAGATTTSRGRCSASSSRRSRRSGLTLRGLEEWPGKDAKVPGHLVLAAEKPDA